MKKERVVKVSEIMGFSPAATKGAYISRLLIDSEGVGSLKLMISHGTLKPGESLMEPGTHPHPYDEAYYILRGQGRVEFGDGEESYEVGPDTAVFIPAGTKHRPINTGTEDLEFLGIWPIMPMKEGINTVCDERKSAWGKSFRKVGEKI
jgi:mannose-6-phosphate isomerase-like protein (cupin superfamily)